MMSAMRNVVRSSDEDPAACSSRMPTLPGVILQKEFLSPKGITKIPGITPRRLKDLVGGAGRFSPEEAQCLGPVFGTSVDFWLNLQAAWDGYQARPNAIRTTKSAAASRKALGREPAMVDFHLFLLMAESLHLTWAQKGLLLCVSAGTLRRWTKGQPRPNQDKRARLRYLAAIHVLAKKASREKGVADWLLRPNFHPFCAGTSPLALLLKGGFEDVLAVHWLVLEMER